MSTGSVPVSFEQAKQEQAAMDASEGFSDTPPMPRPRPTPAAPPVIEDSDQNPAPPPPAAGGPSPEQVKEEMDMLAPNIKPQVWGFGLNQEKNPLRQYVQYELSVIGKMQWFSLVGEFIDKALTGESAISLKGIMSPPDPKGRPVGELRLQDFQEADTFVQAVGKLLAQSPDFMMKSICIWLNVPDYEWDMVQDLMKQSPQLGGLSDDMFEGIFSTFIDQNYPSIDSFFRERLARMRARVQARVDEAAQSRSQKR